MVAGVRDALACGSSHRRRKARARGKRPCTRLAREQGIFCPRRLFTAEALAVFPSKGWLRSSSDSRLPTVSL